MIVEAFEHGDRDGDGLDDDPRVVAWRTGGELVAVVAGTPLKKPTWPR